MLFFILFLSFCLRVICKGLRKNSEIFVNLRRSSGQFMRERSDRWPEFLVFKSVPGCIEGIPGHYGMFGGIMGCSRGVPGLFRAVPGCSGGVPGVFRGVPGCSGCVPGFIDTRTAKRQGLDVVSKRWKLRMFICYFFPSFWPYWVSVYQN